MSGRASACSRKDLAPDTMLGLVFFLEESCCTWSCLWTAETVLSVDGAGREREP